MSDSLFFKIAEQKIQEAIEQGELDNLPGKDVIAHFLFH
jgi:hypothetical protein